MKNEDLSNYEEHKKNIINWEKEFKYILSQINNKKMELFPIDKNWFEDYKKSVLSDKLHLQTQVYNYKNFQPIDYSNIILDEKTINPDASFILLNEESFNSFYEIKNLNNNYKVKIEAHFENKKMIAQIGSNLFYFYYLDENDLIQEGFFIFDEIEDNKKKIIIHKFIFNDINDFIYEYFQNINPILHKNKKTKCYHIKTFDLIIKINKNEISTNKNLKNISNLVFDENKDKERNLKIINITKISNSKVKKKIKNNNLEKSLNNDIYSNIKNIKNNNIDSDKYFGYKNSDKTNNNFTINRIVDCIYEYFYSEKDYKNFINATNKINKIFIPINKDWINNFLEKCSYIKIKNILLRKESSIHFKEIIEQYLKNNNIVNIVMNPIPSISQNKIKNIYKYYDNYELITKNSYDIFTSVFGIDISGNKIEFRVFLIDLFNYIFIKYNNYSAEIQHINKTENYFIYSENYLEKIKENFFKYGFTNGLSFYRVKLDKKIADYKLLQIDNSIIVGTLINLNAKTIIMENEEEDSIINNEEEVFDNRKDNKIDNFEEEEEKNKNEINMPKTSRFLNIIKMNQKDRNNSPISLRKNLNYINFDKNDITMFNDVKNNNSNIYNFKNNSQYNNNNNFRKDSNNNFSNVYFKKNVSYAFEPVKKSNNENINENENENKLKFKTPISKIKQKNYFNKLPLVTNNTNKNNSKYINNKNNTNKFIEEEEEEENASQNPKGLIGLLNVGATCYMNATIQCFSNIPRLREELINNINYQKLYIGRYDKTKLTFALAEVFMNLWKNKKIKYFSPKYFKKIISEMNPLFQGIAANDSKDLILFILETIHNELNQNFKKVYISNGNNLDFISLFNDISNYYKNNNKSIISEEFYGFYNSMMKCCSCNTVTHNIQIINILFFPLEEIRKFVRTQYNFVTLENCFEYYENPELLENGNNIYCNYCKKNSSAITQNKIIISPKTLIINLNRGKGLQFNVGIKFEEYLNLKKYIFKNEESPYYYELVGVISHLGTNDMGGHFIAYCKNSYDCQWYKYNDAQVTKSSFQELCQIGLPYVLYYSIFIN